MGDGGFVATASQEAASAVSSGMEVGAPLSEAFRYACPWDPQRTWNEGGYGPFAGSEIGWPGSQSGRREGLTKKVAFQGDSP